MLRDPIDQGYRLLDTVKGAQLSQKRHVKLVGAAAAAFCLFIIPFAFLYSRLGSSTLQNLPPTADAAEAMPQAKIALCDGFDRTNISRLQEAEATYQGLRDDKFT